MSDKRDVDQVLAEWGEETSNSQELVVESSTLNLQQIASKAYGPVAKAADKSIIDAGRVVEAFFKSNGVPLKSSPLEYWGFSQTDNHEIAMFLYGDIKPKNEDDNDKAKELLRGLERTFGLAITTQVDGGTSVVDNGGQEGPLAFIIYVVL